MHMYHHVSSNSYTDGTHNVSELSLATSTYMYLHLSAVIYISSELRVV